MHNTTTATKPSFLLLFLLISFGSINAVAFTPGLPEISQQFSVSAGQAGWTVSIFLIGYTIGQLLYGPLANRYGRKIALYIGIVLEIIASLLCVVSANFESFNLLMVGRLLMALGASVGLTMSFTLVADSYSPQQARKMVSHLIMAFAITPALGVAIGGFLVEHFGWPSCFYFSGLYGVLLLFLVWHMPETHTAFDHHALKPKQIIKKYFAVLQSRQLLLGAMMMGTMVAIIYIFATLAPFIAMQIMHLSPSQYGLWNLVPMLGVLLGAQLSAYFSDKISLMRAVAVGVVMLIIGIVIMLIAFLTERPEVLFLFIPMVVIRVGSSFVYASSSNIATSTVVDKSNGSAMMTFISMAVATLSVLGLGALHTVTALLLPISYVGIILFLGILIFLLTKGTKSNSI